MERVEIDSVGGRVVHLRTDDSSAAGCPSCGVLSKAVKGNVSTAPRDIPYGEALISIVWQKRRWRCLEQLCGRGSFTESIEELPAGARTTGRLRRAVAAAVADAARSVAESAAAFGVSWPTAHAAVVELGAAQLSEPEPVTVLGIDETRRGKPRWHYDPDSQRWVRTDPWDTGFVDLSGDQGLLGQVEGRTSACVVTWLKARTPEFREQIRFVAIDPAAVYAHAVATAGLLPNATLVVDHFHLVKLANDAVTKVRRRVIVEQTGHRGRAVDPAWANRRRLLTGRERLSDKAFAAMWNTLIDADPTAQILTAWIAKEELRKLLALARSDASRREIATQLGVFYHWCAETEISELHTLATTIETWWPAIHAFISTGITNAKTEGLNRLIKQVKRSACGFRNVTNSHRRIRLHCTRTHRTATARSRTATPLPA